MQTPARRVVMEALFWELGRRLDGKRLPAAPGPVRCRITGRPDDPPDTFELHFSEGRCRVSRGASGQRPAMTLTLDERELVRLAMGRSSPLQALLNGRLRVGGDIAAVAAMLLAGRD